MVQQLAPLDASPELEAAGLRFGAKGMHTTRTMMVAEMRDLLAEVPRGAAREEYAHAIVEENVLGKQTVATRRLTNTRLGELYSLDPRIPVFRVLRRLWELDVDGRPLLALLCAIGRDPILRCTVPSIIGLPVGSELVRTDFSRSIRDATGSRFNESTLDKVARNVGSTWTQSGHLQGRVRKARQRVNATVGSAAFAIWLGEKMGLAGAHLLDSGWARILDSTAGEMVELALRAKQLGLIRARIGGGVVEIDAGRLDDMGGQIDE
ncbi:hypothetical protein HOI71_03610 [Candidatus Poribacteria bacterium]|jgi:hypothetical protein|nr:hypothetical protein [Candidatus Poribacteria bacterium]MBT7806163.1 hypothetical protein [Candidatus Poribacteria bacterium]